MQQLAVIRKRLLAANAPPTLSTLQMIEWLIEQVDPIQAPYTSTPLLRRIRAWLGW